MVDLKDLVRDSIAQIVSGLREADEILAEHGAAVNPTQRSLPPGVTAHNGKIGHKGYFTACQDIDFDIALSVSEGGESGVRVGVLTGIFGGAAEATNRDSQETVR